MTKLVFFSDIDFKGSPKVRAKLNKDVVIDYAEKYEHKEEMPPPILMFDPNKGKPFWVVDGRHRIEALMGIKRKAIECEVKHGTRVDALIEALCQNISHGLRRTQADKKSCILEALRQWPEQSDRYLGDLCHVDNKTVAACRKLMGGQQPAKRIGKDNRERPAPQPKAEGLDRTDYPIPKEIIPLWNRAEDEGEEILKALRLVRNALQKSEKEDDPLWRDTFVNKATADIDSAIVTLSTVIPFAVCTVCQGHPELQEKNICRWCKGRGFISRFKWDRVSDNIKKIRAKTAHEATEAIPAKVS